MFFATFGKNYSSHHRQKQIFTHEFDSHFSFSSKANFERNFGIFSILEKELLSCFLFESSYCLTFS